MELAFHERWLKIVPCLAQRRLHSSRHRLRPPDASAACASCKDRRRSSRICRCGLLGACGEREGGTGVKASCYLARAPGDCMAEKPGCTMGPARTHLASSPPRRTKAPASRDSARDCAKVILRTRRCGTSPEVAGGCQKMRGSNRRLRLLWKGANRGNCVPCSVFGGELGAGGCFRTGSR